MGGVPAMTWRTLLSVAGELLSMVAGFGLAVLVAGWVDSWPWMMFVGGLVLLVWVRLEYRVARR